MGGIIRAFLEGGRRVVLASVCSLFLLSAQGATNVHLTGVPDYEWFAGCAGTAVGNLMGFWDRHGFPNFYTGHAGYGVAPLDSYEENYGIRSLWATKAGLDGRPIDEPGHMDDYFFAFAGGEPDPCVTLGRSEHQPDCLGDFIGLNQNKWKNLNGECDGNIDGYAFVYWDSSGERRWNFTPGPEAGLPAVDIQSGLRLWTESRSCTADVFTQLTDFNSEVPSGRGFAFSDFKAEIDAGYPVLMFLQDSKMKSQLISGTNRANPFIHVVLAYGYFVSDDGVGHVRIRDSYAGGDTVFRTWTTNSWWGDRLPVRGVIGYRPRPQITEVSLANDHIRVRWVGPDSELYDSATDAATKLHWYVLETAPSLDETEFIPITHPTSDHVITVPTPDRQPSFFRLKLVPPPTM